MEADEPLPVIHGKGEKYLRDSANTGAGSTEKQKKKSTRQQQFLLLATIAFGTLLTIGRFAISSSSVSTSPIATSKRAVPYNPDVSSVARQWGQNCTALPPLALDTPTVQNDLDPIFVPGYPTSTGYEGSGDFMKNLIPILTNLKNGHKNYHASSRKLGLKRCHSEVDNGVTCATIHPMVAVGPDVRTDLFLPSVIMPLRNPVTSIPLFWSQKKNRYGKRPGPLNSTEWRIGRENIVSEFEKWKDLILEWKSFDYYNIDMYLPYEHVMDSSRGLQVIQEMSTVLAKLGFPVAREVTECLWFQSVEAAFNFEREYLRGTSFPLTRGQRDELAGEMLAFAKEQQDADPALYAILMEYYEYILYFVDVDNSNDGE